MSMQTIACIFISKIKPQIVAVELFQVENLFHQNGRKFTLKNIKVCLTIFPCQPH